MELYTYNGNLIDLTANDYDDAALSWDDLLIPLSRKMRFGGALHIDNWSVSHHSLACYWFAGEHGVSNVYTLLAILLHDIQEAFLGDIPAPIRNELRIGNDSFNHFEEEVRRKIILTMLPAMAQDVLYYYSVLRFRGELDRIDQMVGSAEYEQFSSFSWVGGYFPVSEMLSPEIRGVLFSEGFDVKKAFIKEVDFCCEKLTN